MNVLSEKQIKCIVEVIVKNYKPDRVILFGSYAKGNPHKWSDLDFMIIKKTRTPFIKRPIEIMDLFNPYPHAMDFFVYTPQEFDKSKNNSGSLAYFVNKEGRVMYGS